MASALEIIPRTRAPGSRGLSLFCEVEGCRAFHGSLRTLPVYAKWVAFILGIRAGVLCDKHRKEWLEAWDHAFRGFG